MRGCCFPGLALLHIGFLIIIDTPGTITAFPTTTSVLREPLNRSLPHGQSPPRTELPRAQMRHVGAVGLPPRSLFTPVSPQDATLSPRSHRKSRAKGSRASCLFPRGGAPTRFPKMRGGGPRQERWARSSQTPPSLRRLVPRNLAALLRREPTEGRSLGFGGFSASSPSPRPCKRALSRRRAYEKRLGVGQRYYHKGPLFGRTSPARPTTRHRLPKLGGPARSPSSLRSPSSSSPKPIPK